MNEALQLIYYVYQKLMNFLFRSYFFDGVSLGMFMVVCFIFAILLNYLLAVPKINTTERPKKFVRSNGGKKNES